MGSTPQFGARQQSPSHARRRWHVIRGEDSLVSLMSGMVAYWRLEEATGNRIDQHINHLDLTPANSPGNTAGAVTSNGAANGYLTSATNMSLDAGTSSQLA